MEAIRNAANTEYTGPKQLCHMSYHSGTIHTVRFSPDGRWLASGADDKIICVYHLEKEPPAHGASFGELDSRMEGQGGIKENGEIQKGDGLMMI